VNKTNGWIQDTFTINSNSVVLKDSIGNVLDKDNYSNITDGMGGMDAGEDGPKCITVEIEATHTGITKNYTEYIAENMKRSAPTWTAPYNKPVLKDHNTCCDTLGRVREYEFMKSTLAPDKDTIKLTLEITDEDCIKRHLNGTALTYSIGAIAKEVYCSICGTDIINSEDFCGHMKGNKYTTKKEGDKGKGVTETCIWQIGDMEYIEVSEVNVPADEWAQVINVTIKEPDMMNDPSMDPEMDSKDSLEIQETNITDSLELVDELLDNTVTADEEIAITEITDEVIVVDDTMKLLEDKVNTLDLELNETKTKLAYAEDGLAKALESNKVLESEMSILNDKNKHINTVNIELAKTIKRIYADSILDGKIRVGQISDSERETELNNIMTKTAKELSDILIKLKVDEKSNISLPKVTQANIGEDGALKFSQDKVDLNEKEIISESKTLTSQDAVNQILNLRGGK